MDNNQPTLSNVPEWSVSDLSGAIKRAIEENFGFVRLRGEVSGYRGPHSSGHVYFALKDQSAKIEAVIWKGVFGRLRFRPEEGMEVVATGKISTFPGKSGYQIIIENLEPAGAGALMMMLEERRKKLTDEGLFDANRKQPLPLLPKVIAVVTSPTGAVIRDILHRIHDRFPVHVLVYPVRVQGETCAEEVSHAIRDLNALSSNSTIPRPDLIIVARGGGSLEDLWGFNEESVVRAASESQIPLISAIGHETDWSLLDLAADVRAPTPTAAAEMALPVRTELLANVANQHTRLLSSLSRMLKERKLHLRATLNALPKPQENLARKAQFLDLLEQKIKRALETNARKNRASLTHLSARLTRVDPKSLYIKQNQRLLALQQRLPLAMSMALKHKSAQFNLQARPLTPTLLRTRIQKHQQSLQAQTRLLESLSHKGVLNRGFAYVTKQSGQLISRANQTSPNDTLTLTFADGQTQVIVKDTH